MAWPPTLGFCQQAQVNDYRPGLSPFPLWAGEVAQLQAFLPLGELPKLTPPSACVSGSEMQPRPKPHKALAAGLTRGWETDRGWILTQNQQGGHKQRVCPGRSESLDCSLPLWDLSKYHFAMLSLRVLRGLMEKCNETKQQGVMLSTRTPLEAHCGEGGLVPGRGQGTVSECRGLFECEQVEDKMGGGGMSVKWRKAPA